MVVKRSQKAIAANDTLNRISSIRCVPEDLSTCYLDPAYLSFWNLCFSRPSIYKKVRLQGPET